MAEVNFSIEDLFARVFGYQTNAFKPQFDPVRGDGGQNSVTRTNYGAIANSPYYLSLNNGQEVYLPIELQVGSDTIPGTNTTYAEALGVTANDGAYTGRLQLPYPIFSVESKLHVIDTELTERPGMVSELINMSGYKLSVKGLFINKANEFPESDFTLLTKLYEFCIPVRINNPITDVLFLKAANNGENLVTIRNFRMNDGKGVKHVRGYELEIWQEVPFNLIDIGS